MVQSRKRDGDLRSGAVGNRLGKLFQIDVAPSFVASSMHSANMAITKIWCDDPVFGVTDPVPPEDAYLACLLVADMQSHEVWENGKPFPRRTVKAGATLLRDLKRGQAALIDQPHHSIHFYLPRAALDEIADDAEVPRIGELAYRPGVPFDDAIVRSLGTLLSPAFQNPERVHRLFLEHILLSLGVHLAKKYGGLADFEKRALGGLAPWQERRAKEIMLDDMQADLSLAKLAEACGMSVRHLSRAFKRTTGLPPHRWLLRRRVERAKELLEGTDESLGAIALKCGFADQSHLTRVFQALAGSSPGAWRRQRRI